MSNITHSAIKKITQLWPAKNEADCNVVSPVSKPYPEPLVCVRPHASYPCPFSQQQLHTTPTRLHNKSRGVNKQLFANQQTSSCLS
jgi:hypothetical protein